MTPGAEGFRDFIAGLGFTPPERIEPGQWAPFSTNGKGSDTAGRAKLFPDQEGGVIYDWRTGESHTWQSRRERSPDEIRSWLEKIERARVEAAAEREREGQQARERAAKLWKEAQSRPADDSHPYLSAKGVKSYRLRVYRGPLCLRGMKCDGALMIPSYDAQGALASLQFIASPGEDGKRYLHGPRPKGCYFSIGKPQGVICIAEGYATAASIHEATGHAVAVAFDAGNLTATANALREKYSEARIILCADNDVGGEINRGVSDATSAALAVGGRLAIPELNGAKCDFNDLARERGAEAVKAAVDAARAPAMALPQPIPKNRAEAVLASPAATVRVLRGDDVQIVPVCWYWSGYLPGGKVVLIGGAPGTGKTTLAIDLASTITVGGRWPDRARADVGDVLVWSGEDSVSDTLAPRFMASGADMARVHFVTGVDTERGGRPFDPAQDFPKLVETAKRIPQLRLIIVDPIVMAVAGDSHKNAETRRGLQPLVDFAERSGAVVLGVTHFSKGTQGREPIERITGSLAFAAVARLVLVAAKIDEANGGGRVLVRSKSNLGPDGGGFNYELEPVEAQPGVATSRIKWGGPIEGNARDILASAEVTGDPTGKEETLGASEWLQDTLAQAGGELSKAEVIRRGIAAGFSERTLHRVRERIRATAEVTGFGRDKRSVWRLPHVPIRATEPSIVPIVPDKSGGMNGTNGGTNGDREVF